MKPFKPEHNFHVSVERIRQAQALYHQADSYALAMYVAGVAVECMLRAFKGLRDPAFDEKHDLLLLFKASGMLKIDEDLATTRGYSRDQSQSYAVDLRAAVNDIYSLWSNDFRFASEDRLLAQLRKKKRSEGRREG